MEDRSYNLILTKAEILRKLVSSIKTARMNTTAIPNCSF